MVPDMSLILRRTLQHLGGVERAVRVLYHLMVVVTVVDTSSIHAVYCLKIFIAHFS